MDRKLNIQDLADLLARRAGLPRRESEAYVRQFFETITASLLHDQIVKVKGLGTFKIVEVSDRESVDVNTGRRILISGHPKVTFTPDTTLRDQVNKPFMDFQTVILNDGTDTEEMERIDSPSVTLPPAPPAVEEETPEAVEEEETPVVEVEEPPSVVEEEEVTTEMEEEEIPAVVEEETPVVEEAPEAVEEEEAPAEPAAAQPQGREEKPSAVLQVLRYAAVVALMAGSYFAGYYHIFCPDTPQAQPQAVAETPAVVLEQKKDSIVPQPAPREVAEEAPQPPTPEEMAAEHPQIPGGRYLIVGTKAVHKMSVGDNLYKIARSTYGSNEMVQYIVVYNRFKNPDVIPPGYAIKLPELVEIK